jgi:hypothetical protein
MVSVVGVIAAACVVSGADAAGAGHAAFRATTVSAAQRPADPVSRRLALLRAVDLRTRAGVERYLRAIGVDPRHVVIQHGDRNYAGPRCPGRGWTCTTATRVLQAGAANVAQCSPGALSSPTPGETDCVIVQSGGGTATCNLRSSDALTIQRCDITQTSIGADNKATVTQIVQSNGAAAGDEEATQSATITQSSSGGGSNVASVQQQANESLGVPNAGTAAISQIQGANEFAQVTQDTCTLVSGSCSRTHGPGDNTSNVSQSETQQEHANGGGALTQLQNAQPGSGKCDDQANACYVVRQTSASGANTTTLDQRLNQVQEANHVARGRQAQGSLGDPFAGGLDHAFVQSSAGGGLSKQQSMQQESQTQHNDTSAIATSQVGPVKKGSGRQTGNANDAATQTQSAQQASNGSGAAADREFVSDQCASDGNCSAQQTVNSNGSVSTISQSGSSISLLSSCSNGVCNSTTPVVVDCTADASALTTALASQSLANGTTMLITGTCNGPFVIARSLTLIGNPAATLDGQHAGTDVTTAAGTTVVLSHLTITNGSSSGNSAIGGIDNEGTLTVSYSSVTGNTAASPGADVGSATGGVQSNGPSLSVMHSNVDANTGTVVRGFAFGGIFAGGTMTLSDSTVDQNTATATGTIGNRAARAGIEFTGTSMTMTRSSVSGNVASAPTTASGGLLVGFAPVTVTDSTVSGNSALAGGGTVGGISNITQLRLSGTTVSGNSAVSVTARAVGGIANSGTASLMTSTVSGNTATDETGKAVGGVLNFVQDAPASMLVTDSNVTGNSASTSEGVAIGGVSNEPPATISLSNSPVVDNTPANCDFSDPNCA